MVKSRPADWTAGEVPVFGGRLAYHRTGGKGPPLILSHGLTDNGLCWTRLARALEADFDIIMLDARGHGASSGVGPGDVVDPVRDLAEAVEALGLTRVLVMGHSVGARASAGYAAAFPDRVRALVLEDPPLVPPMTPEARERRLQAFREQVARFRSMTEAELRAFGMRQSPSWDPIEFPAWAASKRQVDAEALPLLNSAWQEDFRSLQSPTLLIHGESERGSMVAPQQAREALEHNPNLRAVRIPGAGHNVRRENFADVLLAVRSFLAAV
jgi:pimeloyl-ACP methyl ester carboxylesterase